MEVLFQKNGKALLEYLPSIKSSLKEWVFVDIKLTDTCGPDFTATNAAALVCPAFKEKEGRLYICGEREVFMLLHWGKEQMVSEVSRIVDLHLPAGSCTINAHEATAAGMAKLEVLITQSKMSANRAMAILRSTREEKIIIIADDDMYMRGLVRAGMPTKATIHEVSDGAKIVSTYKQYAPNILFLDIHLPNMDGFHVLRNILAIDPEAYVIMLSADSSPMNVNNTLRKGAKGFLTKPFTKEKLFEYVAKCPTIT